MDTLASRLKRARDLREWTQERLAKEAGVSQGTIGNAEAGLRTAPNRLPDIADALGVRYRWLRYGEEPMTASPIRWPFSGVPLESFEALHPEQQIEIRGVVRQMIANFAADNGKRRAADE